jgi:hypothetical protein
MCVGTSDLYTVGFQGSLRRAARPESVTVSYFTKDLIQSYYLVVKLIARPFYLLVLYYNLDYIAYRKILLSPILICLLFY